VGRPDEPDASTRGRRAVTRRRLPGPLRAYAVALRRLVTAVIGAGLLPGGTPPLVTLPRAPTLGRDLRPVGRGRTLATGHPAGPPEPDDDALEAEHLKAAAERPGANAACN
jgi:hypothetical protein